MTATKIGEIANRPGIGIETIRYYQRETAPGARVSAFRLPTV